MPKNTPRAPTLLCKSSQKSQNLFGPCTLRHRHTKHYCEETRSSVRSMLCIYSKINALFLTLDLAVYQPRGANCVHWLCIWRKITLRARTTDLRVSMCRQLTPVHRKLKRTNGSENWAMWRITVHTSNFAAHRHSHIVLAVWESKCTFADRHGTLVVRVINHTSTRITVPCTMSSLDQEHTRSSVRTDEACRPRCTSCDTSKPKGQ